MALSVHDPGCLHDPSAHAHNDVVENAHAQMTILFCDDLRHCSICSTLAHLCTAKRSIHSFSAKKMECSEIQEKFALYAAVRQYLVDGLVDAALKKKVSRMAANFVIRGK